MTKYLLKRNLLVKPEIGEVAEAGTVIELNADDDRTKDLLERGTIVEDGKGVEYTPAPTAFEKAAAETEAANADVVAQQAEQAQKQEEAQAEIDARRAELAARGEQPTTQAAGESDQATNTQLEPADTTLTPEQVQQDFQQAGVENTPDEPQAQ